MCAVLKKQLVAPGKVSAHVKCRLKKTLARMSPYACARPKTLMMLVERTGLVAAFSLCNNYTKNNTNINTAPANGGFKHYNPGRCSQAKQCTETQEKATMPQEKPGDDSSISWQRGTVVYKRKVREREK